MRFWTTLFWAVMLVAVTGTIAAEGTPIPSPATADVLKLAKSGVGDDIILSYVQNEKQPFHLTTDDILALREAKVGNEVIKAMLAHDTPAPSSTPTSTTSQVTIDPDPTPEVIVPVYGYPYGYPYPWHRRHFMIYGW